MQRVGRFALEWPKARKERLKQRGRRFVSLRFPLFQSDAAGIVH
jgi:hypothetical protein